MLLDIARLPQYWWYVLVFLVVVLLVVAILVWRSGPKDGESKPRR